ncbi:MAG: ATP-binding protein, partial [Hyphomicrobium sp.]
MRAAPFDATSVVQGFGGYLPTLAAVLAAGGAVLAVAASGTGQPLLMTLIAMLAIVGLFFLFAIGAGYVRLTERQPLAELVKTVTDRLDTGVMIASRDGVAIYANGTLETIVGHSNIDSLRPLEELFTGEPQANAALYRLTRAAERGEPLSEEFRLKRTAEGVRAARTMRISVRPLDAKPHSRKTGPLIVWNIADITREREQEAARLARLESQLGYFDSAPLGLASVSADGVLRHVNSTLAGWIGRTSRSLTEQRVTLADVVSGDGADLVARLSARSQEEAATLDVDLVREDGRIVPVRLFAKILPVGKGMTIAALGLAEERTAAFEGDASAARFARFFQSAPFGIAILGPDGRIASANAAFSKMVPDGAPGTGIAASEALCRAAEPETKIAVEAGLKRVLSGRVNVAPVEITVGAKKEHVSRVYMSPFVAAGGTHEAAILYVIDATEQKALEAKFAQSQKMEVVGKLAGGVAHDFNNMLTAILGFSDMLLTMHRPKDVAYKDIMNIKSSANRAAELVRKLLALARQQTLQNEVINLGEVLTDESSLLKRYLGEKSELKISSERDLWNVMTDKHEFVQALFNLTTNAKDAMPDGGTLSIRVRNIPERESQKLAHDGISTGEYVLIEVQDTGHGMSPEVMSKVFEPFFTTKDVGKGTGLGLASVYGMVKQSGGIIYPESEAGKGTTFSIYLPRHHSEKEEEVVAAK